MTEAKKVPDLTPPTKGATAKATKAPAAPKAPKEPKAAKPAGESAGAGAPRPRKHEYGIKPDAIVKRAEAGADAAKRAGVAAAYEFTDGNPTVEAFYAKGGDRHDLRVMSRRGLITIVWPTGEVFPQAAVAKAPEAPKPEDAAKAPEATPAAPAS